MVPKGQPNHVGATAATFMTLLMDLFAGTVQTAMANEFDGFMETLNQSMREDCGIDRKARKNRTMRQSGRVVKSHRKKRPRVNQNTLSEQIALQAAAAEGRMKADLPPTPHQQVPPDTQMFEEPEGSYLVADSQIVTDE